MTKVTRLLTLFMVLVFFSCQKEPSFKIEIDNPIPNPPTHDVINNITNKTNESSLLDNNALNTQAVTGILLVKDIFSAILLSSINHPEIFGLQGNPNAAEIRTCPNSSVTPTGGTFPATMSLDFGASPGCSPAGVLPVPFIGQMTAIFEEPIFGSGSAEDILISLSSDFSINGYEIAVANGGSINLNYLSGRYQIELDDDVMVTDPNTGNTTTYHSTSDFGDVNIIGDADDDPNNPLTFVNNAFSMFITDSHVTCSNGTTSTDHCIDITSSANNLTFQPTACGCITGGKLRVNENSDCSSSNSGSNVDTIYDFGDGDCDSEVEVNGTPETMLSCT